MNANAVNFDVQNQLRPLPKAFNKKKFVLSYNVVNNPILSEIQNLSKKQCLGKNPWPEIQKINSWMISAETATFMKWGGLGMIASELPEVFNHVFGKNGEQLSVVTPMYLGDTKKKKAAFEGDVYTGTENKKIQLKKIRVITVPFAADRPALHKFKVTVYTGVFNNTNYIFLANDRFFSINPHPDNPSAQDGCYVMNEFGINEVERFAFFSKAVYELLKEIFEGKIKDISRPNVLIANDWHSGALSGLTKYFTKAQIEAQRMSPELAEKMKSLPIVHVAHHLGYQGWDYDNTSRILNSLYENTATLVFKNAKAIKNSNPRATNTLIVSDCYNQASCNFHLADRVVTVSKNYMEEVSKELGFGFDFRDILKIRKDHRNFFGIVNGYEKKLISPNKEKIEGLNTYFQGFDFQVFDENSLEAKNHNKAEFIKLISKIAADPDYKKSVIPLIDIYKFEDISQSVKNPAETPIFCATSRLVEQKGYDIAAQAILKLIHEFDDFKKELPIFVMGGAGDDTNFAILTHLKDKISQINPKAGERIFVFRGYRDQFAYAVQLASDFYLMPCRFEPCGLTQMEAMAKGALPVAMSTGGLVDTVDDGVNGFRTEVFFTEGRRVYGNNLTAKRLKNNVNAYAETLQKVLDTFYNNPQTITEMKKNAMIKNFGWDVEDGSLYKYYNLLRFGHL
ncbi:MAG: glycogen/starch synthase [Azospirillum sp.]|nr:glycogen/starch synthase [Azospirillum sp.]